MEIIHILLGKANPDRLNGVNKVVYNLATEQTKAGRDVQVWGITTNPVHDYPERNFITLLFQAKNFPFSIHDELRKAILKHPNAVFHLHGGWVPVFSSLARLFTENRIKYVLTPHGAYNRVAMLRSSYIKRIYFQLFEKKLLQNSHKVHSIGKSEVDGLSRICPIAKSHLLPYGFEYNSINPNGCKNDQFTIGFVGRLDKHTKGLDLIMEAFTQFQKQFENSILWIIGDGEGKAYLENFIIENKLKNVVLWGSKYSQERDELIGKMHAFVHPSRNEGLPTAVLEASALGTPAIVSEATNLADYIHDFQAGIAIENENISALSAAMELIHESWKKNNYQFYLEGGKNMLSEIFAWNALVGKYDELYQ
jgi:glycosyltransferase involved in cell wall biosynthesis